jgi:DNA-binding CsgD family transcriptional regulator
MAKTLFFLEALALALVSFAFPSIAADAASAFIFPFAISIVMPLACAAAVWPPSSVFFALRAAFSTKAPGPAAVSSAAAREGARILESLAGFSRAASALGFLFAFVAICRAEPFEGGVGTWTLLGAFLSAYALVNTQLWRILAAVVERFAAVGAEATGGDAAETRALAFAAEHGLTPREWETAASIAAGKSYKETAYELGISIKTVKAHMSRVYEKTGAASNVALALLVKGSSGSSTKVQ